MSDEQQPEPVRPFSTVDPRVARTNQRATGCLFWLTLLPVIVFVVVGVLVGLVFLFD